MDADNGKLLNYGKLRRDTKYKKHWSTSSANEFGRLANGVGRRIKNQPTQSHSSEGRTFQKMKKHVTYGQFICSAQPEKKEKNRTRFTVGRDQIDYPGEVSTPTADILVAKILFNRIMYTKGARFTTGQRKDNSAVNYVFLCMLLLS